MPSSDFIPCVISLKDKMAGPLRGAGHKTGSKVTEADMLKRAPCLLTDGKNR